MTNRDHLLLQLFDVAVERLPLLLCVSVLGVRFVFWQQNLLRDVEDVCEEICLYRQTHAWNYTSEEYILDDLNIAFLMT